MEIERKRAFIIRTVYYLILATFFVLVVKYGLPMLAPFVLGFLIASIMRRPTKFVTRKFHLPHKLTAMLMVLLFYCTIGLLITLLVIRIFGGIHGLVEMIPHLYAVHLEPALAELFLSIETLVYQMDESLFDLILEFEGQVMAWLGSLISGVSAWAVAAVSGFATSIPGLFIELVLMVISSIFIAMDYDRLTGFCLRQMSESASALFLQIKRYLVGTLFVCIASYALIMSLTFVELSIAFHLIGLQHAFLIAVAIAIFDILPVLGTGGIMIPWAVITLIRGDIGMGLKLLLVYVVVTVIRNIVEPKFVGSQLGLHPVVTLASMFVGVQLFGVVGLFGFPIGLSLLRYLNDNGSIHLFKTEADVQQTAQPDTTTVSIPKDSH